MRYLKGHRIECTHFFHVPVLENRAGEISNSFFFAKSWDQAKAAACREAQQGRSRQLEKPFLECDHEIKHGDVDQYLGNVKEMVFFSKIIHI